MRFLGLIVICFLSCSENNSVGGLVDSESKPVLLIPSSFYPSSMKSLEGSVNYWTSNRNYEIEVETIDVKNSPILKIYFELDSQMVYSYPIKSNERKKILFDTLNLEKGKYIISVEDSLGGAWGNYIYR